MYFQVKNTFEKQLQQNILYIFSLHINLNHYFYQIFI
jgi:hypothetical protein